MFFHRLPPLAKQASILIVSTIAVILMLVVCGSLVLQIQTDIRSTQILKYREMVLMVARGAIHEGLNQLNTPSVTGLPQGHIGVTTWNPKTDDVGLDGIPNTQDEGENDGYPTFALPKSSSRGEPGGHWLSILIKDHEEQVLECYYLVYDEDLGNNQRDDNHNDSGDGTRVDDLEEARFHRLKAVASYGGQTQKIETLVGNSENFYLFEAFFKALYAGNASNQTGYTLDLGGTVEQFDDIEGDVYVHGNIRLRDASILWQKERFEDTNGNGTFDFGESVKEIKNQEIGFYNLGTESTGDIYLRSPIGEDWKTRHSEVYEHPTIFTENASHLGLPDFTPCFNRITFRVSEEIHAQGSPCSIVLMQQTVQGKTISDPTHPAHFFIELESKQISSTVSPLHNGLHTYLLQDLSSPSSSFINVVPQGNREVYFLAGNLWIHSESLEPLTFELKDSKDPLRITFLVQGNIVFGNNLSYRQSQSLSFSQKEWNPFQDAIAFIAVKNQTNPLETGHLILADFASQTLDRIDGYLFAENDVLSHSSLLSKRLIIHGSLGAGNQIRINQECIDLVWRALSDEHRTQFCIYFDSRIRQFIRDREWLPGIPSGQNRTMPSIPKRFNNVLSWTER